MNGSPRIRVVASLFPQQRFERALSLDRSSSIVIVVASRVGYRRRLIFRISRGFRHEQPLSTRSFTDLFNNPFGIRGKLFIGEKVI